jgi:urease beta subunit
MTMLNELPPGAVILTGDTIEVNPGLPVTLLTVTNTSRFPVHLTSHLHLFEANPALVLDRRRSFGSRPDLPAGGAVRLEPGETRHIRVIPIQGHRVVRGFAGLVDGPLDEVDVDEALSRAIARGYLHRPEGEV